MHWKYRVRNLVRALGYEVSVFNPEGSLGSHLVVLFRHLAINCVLDVGANRGDFGVFLRNNGYRGHIVSFEPNREVFQQLQRTAQSDGRWTAHNVALGSADETKPFVITHNSYLSSFHRPISHYEGFEVEAVEPVQVRRLDGMLDAVLPPVSHPRLYLKMDTQGWDLEVLRGSSGCLDRILALQTEVAVEADYEGMPMFVEALTTLSALGFGVSAMFKVARDVHSGLLRECDCVMLNRAAASDAAQRRQREQAVAGLQRQPAGRRR